MKVCYMYYKKLFHQLPLGFTKQMIEESKTSFISRKLKMQYSLRATMEALGLDPSL